MSLFFRVTPQGEGLPTNFTVDENTNVVTPVASVPVEASAAKARRRSSVRAPAAAAAASAERSAADGKIGIDARHPCRTEFDAAFAQTTNDESVIAIITERVVPLVAERRNVLLFVDGPAGGGKTCLAEQLLLSVASGLKTPIANANEALREAAVLSAELPGSGEGRRGRDALGGGGSKSTDASSGVFNRASMGTQRTTSIGVNRASVGRDRPSSRSEQGGRSSSRRGASRARPWSAAGSPSKFALLCALPRRDGDNSDAVDLRTVSPTRLDAGKHRLIPDLSDPSNVSPLRSRPASAMGRSAAASPAAGGRARQTGGSPPQDCRGIFRESLRNARSPVRYRRPDSPDSPLVSIRPGMNGRGPGAEVLLPRFTGASFLEVPRWPAVDELLKSSAGMRLSFWLKPDATEGTDGGEADAAPQTILQMYDPIDARYQLLIQFDASPTGGFEAAGFRVVVRDCSGQRLEAHFARAFRADAEWSHLCVDVIPADNNVVLTINGIEASSRVLGASEKPQNFDTDRSKFGRLGARLGQVRGDDVLVEQYRGFMCDISVAAAGARQAPMLSYALEVPTKREDQTRSAFPEVRERTAALQAPLKLADLPVAPTDFIATAPSFDGASSHVSCGPVGDALLRIPSTTIDFDFRSQANDNIMTAIGVTDSPGKHLGFSVDFNCGLSGTFQKHMICAWFRDYNGKLSRCAFEAAKCFDGHWHKLRVRILDIDSGRFAVKVDNTPVTELSSSGRARRDAFLCSSTPITVGAHNDRGTLCKFFRGAIRNVRLRATAADGDAEVVAEWPLAEGPGAAIAVDTSGHGFNGVYWCHGRRGGLTWDPVEAERGWRLGMDGEHRSGEPHDIEVVRYGNNVVQFAAVAVNPVARGGGGQVREEIVNLLKSTPGQGISGGGTVTVATGPTPQPVFELDPIPCGSANPRLNSSDRRTLQVLPQDAFVEVSPTDYLSTVKSAMARASDYERSHIFFFLKLGDACFTLADMVGVQTSPHARYVPRQLAWSDTISTLGAAARRTNLLSRGTSEGQKAVARCGGHPNVFKRSLFLSPNERFETQTAAGSLVTSALLAGGCMASLVHCSVIAPRASSDDLSSVTAVLESLRTNDQTHAAILLQKQFRACLARRRFRDLRGVATEKASRERSNDAARRMDPARCQARAKKHCIIFDFLSAVPGLTPVHAADATEAARLELAYMAAGYTVDVRAAAMVPAAVLEAIAEVPCEEDTLMAVHVLARRHDGPLAPAVSEATEAGWVIDEEHVARIGVEEECAQGLRCLYTQRVSAFRAVMRGLRKRFTAEVDKDMKKKAKKKKAAKPKKGAPPPPTLEELVDAMMPEPLDAGTTFVLTAQSSHDARRGIVDGQLSDSTERKVQSAADLKGAILTSESGAVPTEASTVGLCQLADAVAGRKPNRGRHAIFLFDTVDVSGGVKCGVVASSHESMVLQLDSRRELLFTMYVRQALRGCAVEAVRIGKHAPPEHTTVDTFMRYIRSKVGSSRPLGRAQVGATWFGEYVGDVWVSNRLVTSKEDRRKEKSAPTQKRRLVCIKLRIEAPVGRGAAEAAPHEAMLRQWVSTAVEKQLGVRCDVLRVEYPGALVAETDHFCPELQRNPVAATFVQDKAAAIGAALGADPRRVSVTAPRLCFSFDVLSQFDVPQAQAQVQGAPNGAAAPSPAEVAGAYVAAMNQRKSHLAEVVFPAMVRCTAQPEAAAPLVVRRISVDANVYLQLTDAVARRLDRAARTGELDEPVADESAKFTVSLAGASALSESELQRFDGHDRMLAAFEAGQQALLKQKMAQQQDARQRQADARAAAEQNRADAADGIESFLRDHAASAPEVPAATKVASLFDVPLVDLVVSGLDAIARACKAQPGSVPQWIDVVPGAVAKASRREASDGMVIPGSAPLPMLQTPKVYGALAKLVIALSVVAESITADPESVIATTATALLSLAADGIVSMVGPAQDRSTSLRDILRTVASALEAWGPRLRAGQALFADPQDSDAFQARSVAVLDASFNAPASSVSPDAWACVWHVAVPNGDAAWRALSAPASAWPSHRAGLHRVKAMCATGLEDLSQALQLLDVVHGVFGAIPDEDSDVAHVRSWVAAQLSAASEGDLHHGLLIRVCQVLLATTCDAPTWVEMLLAAGGKIEAALAGEADVDERLPELWSESHLQQLFVARTNEAAEALLRQQQMEQAQEDQQA